MSEFTASAHEALLEEGVAKQKTAEKKPMGHQIFKFFLTCLGWSPLVLSLAVKNPRAMLTGAAGAALSSFCLSGIFYKMGGTKVWPKIMDISFLSTFGILTILAWTLPVDTVGNILPFLDVFIFGGFALTIGAAWACFKLRFMDQVMLDYVSDEELRHPSIQHIIVRNTQLILSGFTLMAVIAAVNGTLSVTGNNTNTLRIVLLVLEYSILGIMMTIAHWLYPEYIGSEKGMKMIGDKYPDECAAWNAANPDHEWAY
mmetsp:Transcript_23700/g.40346  ORF Transcript_23700/g.40346 Transcript_23700/m.40346 type:complete len:257 (-) Transcript_23700:121-891(-)